MKVGVISDTHDRLPPFARAIALFKRLKVDAILHAGDYVAPFAAKLIAPEALGGIPLHCVYGNNDGERAGLKKTLPSIQDGPLRVVIGGRTIVMAHFDEWLKPGDTTGAHVIVTGHTHQVVTDKRPSPTGDQLWLNPGECCGWVTDRCTIALLDLDTLEPQIVELHGG